MLEWGISYYTTVCLFEWISEQDASYITCFIILFLNMAGWLRIVRIGKFTMFFRNSATNWNDIIQGDVIPLVGDISDRCHLFGWGGKDGEDWRRTKISGAEAPMLCHKLIDSVSRSTWIVSPQLSTEQTAQKCLGEEKFPPPVSSTDRLTDPPGERQIRRSIELLVRLPSGTAYGMFARYKPVRMRSSSSSAW